MKEPYKPKNSPYYAVRVTLPDGARKQISLRTTDLAEAKRFAKQAVKEANQGNTHVLEKAKVKENTSLVSDITEAYLDDTERRCRESTAIYNVQSLELLLKETGVKLKGARVGKLTKALVSKFISQRLKGLKKGGAEDRSARVSVNAIVKHARSVFSRHQLLGECYSKFRLGNLEGFLQANLATEYPKKYKWIGDEEFAKILQSSTTLRDGVVDPITGNVVGKDVALYVAFLLCYTTGIRRAEAVAARWSWIKRNQQDTGWVLEVPEWEEQDDIFFRTKSDKGREIPIAGAVIKELRYCCGEKTSGWVIPEEGKYNRNRKLWERLKAWWVRLDINVAKPAHELRKFFGAQIASHQSIYAASKLLGHQKIETTEEYYADYIKEFELPKIKLPSLKVIASPVKYIENTEEAK